LVVGVRGVGAPPPSSPPPMDIEWVPGILVSVFLGGRGRGESAGDEAI
jgi:hypothetical protein